ncbi:MAG: hypothetical protein ACHQ5A_01260 [Opitutales bacterium]
MRKHRIAIPFHRLRPHRQTVGDFARAARWLCEIGCAGEKAMTQETAFKAVEPGLAAQETADRNQSP